MATHSNILPHTAKLTISNFLSPNSHWLKQPAHEDCYDQEDGILPVQVVFTPLTNHPSPPPPPGPFFVCFWCRFFVLKRFIPKKCQPVFKMLDSISLYGRRRAHPHCDSDTAVKSWFLSSCECEQNTAFKCLPECPFIQCGFNSLRMLGFWGVGGGGVEFFIILFFNVVLSPCWRYQCRLWPTL